MERDWRSDNVLEVRGRQRQAARGVDTGDKTALNVKI